MCLSNEVPTIDEYELRHHHNITPIGDLDMDVLCGLMFTT